MDKSTDRFAGIRDIVTTAEEISDVMGEAGFRGFCQ